MTEQFHKLENKKLSVLRGPTHPWCSNALSDWTRRCFVAPVSPLGTCGHRLMTYQLSQPSTVHLQPEQKWKQRLKSVWQVTEGVKPNYFTKLQRKMISFVLNQFCLSLKMAQVFLKLLTCENRLIAFSSDVYRKCGADLIAHLARGRGRQHYIPYSSLIC